MQRPISRYTEEALVAGILLHDLDLARQAQSLYDDDDLFYEDLRLISRAARSAEPLSAATVCRELGADLDRVRWQNLDGEVLIVDLCNRFLFDPSAWYPPAMASLVRAYADDRRRFGRAQRAAQAASDQVLNDPAVALLARYEGMLEE